MNGKGWVAAKGREVKGKVEADSLAADGEVEPADTILKNQAMPMGFVQ